MLDEILGFNGIDFALLVVVAIFVTMILVRLALDAFSYFYVVIPPEQVHVIVSRKGKKAYMSDSLISYQNKSFVGQANRSVLFSNRVCT